MFSNKIQTLHYKKLFLYGVYVVIMLLSVVASVVDFLIGNMTDMVIDVLFGLTSFFAYRTFFLQEKLVTAAVSLFWISVLIEFLYLVVHSVDFNIIFAVLIPIIAFIAMPKRVIICNLTLYYILLIFFFLYYYHYDTTNPFLHNSAYMVAYVMAHLFILAFGVFYYLAIDESVKRLETANKNQKLLLNEVHHRVKNNLNLISSILGLQLDTVSDNFRKQFLKENQRRIESMAILHEILYSRGTVTNADLKEYVEILVEHLVSSATSEKIEVETDIVRITLPMESMIQLGIMINEMMTNSIKHLSRHKEKLQIHIHFEANGEGAYILYYCDNASHIDTKLLEEGFGYNLIVLTARYFNADVTYDISDGFCYRIVFERMREV